MINVFKEISLGGLSKEDLIAQLAQAGVQFNKYAHTLFEDAGFSPPMQKERVELVKLQVSDLGINHRSSLQQILTKASEFGLRPCPLYLGAFLRLQYLEQPEGPHLTIASLPPAGDDNYPTGFYVRNSDKLLWLRGYRAEGECDWPSGNEFIFLVLPR